MSTKANQRCNSVEERITKRTGNEREILVCSINILSFEIENCVWDVYYKSHQAYTIRSASQAHKSPSYTERKKEGEKRT